MQISLDFKTSCCNLIYFNFGRSYDVLKSKSSYILLNKSINFNKNRTESKMENLTHTFRETNLVFHLIQESQIKSKTVMSWISRKKKESIFCIVYFVRREFFNISFLSQCLVYWIHFQSIHTFTYQKILLHTLLFLASKIVESLQRILKERIF